MERENLRIMRGVVISAGVFALLFLLHIVAAANDMDAFFRIIAILITAQILFCGFSIQILSGLNELADKKAMNRIGLLISIPLSIGLGRAYAGMEFDVTVLFWVFATLILHLSRQYWLGLQDK